MADKYLDASYQRLVGEFVNREVHYNVSTLISDLAKNDAGEYWDNILAVCVTDDWQTAAEDAGWRYNFDAGAMNHDDHDPHLDHTWQDICEEFDIEPHQIEAYEHWIVSDWLADQLESMSEMVSKDIHGLTVWGRTTTGQSILLDRVICDIYDRLHKVVAA